MDIAYAICDGHSAIMTVFFAGPSKFLFYQLIPNVFHAEVSLQLSCEFEHISHHHDKLCVWEGGKGRVKDARGCLAKPVSRVSHNLTSVD